MAGRIRTIKPELLDDEIASGLSDAAWRLFVSSWLLADDQGNFRAGARYLAAQVWQDTTKDALAPLLELVRAGRVLLYESDGQVYATIPSWSRHQRVDNAGKPRVPPPPTNIREVSANLAETLGGSPLLPQDSPLYLRPPTSDLRPPTNKNPVSNPPPSGSGLSSDIGPELTTASACCPETPSAPTTERPIAHAPVLRAQPPVQLALVPTADPSPSAALVAPRPEPDAEGTTATPDATEPASAKHDPVAAIFSEYIAGWKKQTKGRRAPVLDAKRRRLTLDRLKTFSEEDLKSAARGIWKHPWNLENQQTSYDLAMRDSAHVEKFMAADEASKPQPARGGVPEWLDTGRPSDRLVAYMKSPEYKPTPTNVDIAALLASVGPAEMQ